MTDAGSPPVKKLNVIVGKTHPIGCRQFKAIVKTLVVVKRFLLKDRSSVPVFDRIFPYHENPS
jgi:hypothetical protein